MTQRGNRRAGVFFGDDDRRRYLFLLGEYARRHGVAIRAYRLMTNCVHFVAVSSSSESPARAFRDTHQAHAAWLNRKIRQSGHLWQGRYFSCVLDAPHMWACVWYVERNAVRAGLVAQAEDWPWSSAAAHCGGQADSLLSAVEMPWPVPNWAAYLHAESPEETAAIRRQTTIDRPCGSQPFVERSPLPPTPQTPHPWATHARTCGIRFPIS